MSRLLEGNIEYNGQNISIEEYRKIIFARSLYSIDNEYENTNKFSLNNKGNVASSISTILNVIPQYNRMQINTNLLGNTYDAFRNDGSALTQIGLIMLGKQMAYNSAMNLTTKYIPNIDLSQALKGNSKNIFKLNKDNTITIKNPDDKTFLDNVGSVASNFLGIDTYDVFGDSNPFSKNSTKIDYLKNTGNVQLSRFLSAVNLNIYKPLNNINDSQYTQLLIDKMNSIGPKLQSSEDSILVSEPNGIRPIFNFDDSSAHKYFNKSLSSTAIESATKNMLASYSINNNNNMQEYAPNYSYIKNNFGEVVKKSPEKNILNIVKEQTNLNNNIKQQIVWGRDGVGDEAKSKIKNLRGSDDNINNHGDTNIFTENNIKKGLLEYTRNLLNASEGNFVDITRKAFKDGNNYIGFNGSPLWMANDSKYIRNSGNFEKTGIRQHTILDPYDKAAKTIRFKGNQVYSQVGNKNSVIYNNILPRIHPTNKNKDGNMNLMFSLENLAVGTIRRDKEGYGVIDDEYGTPIPLTEVGQFGGRKMWFPPYNIQLNEVAAAKYESTVMVGRNEPIYNYMNSERSAVLSFSLLVDYPEQLKNKNLRGENKNKAIADFFAFGGDPLPKEYDIEQIEKKIRDLENQLEIENPIEQAELPDKGIGKVNIYFQNNRPKIGEESIIIQTMFDNPNHYEITNEILSARDNNTFGLNQDIYVIDGLVENPNSNANNKNKYILIDSYDQYNSDLSISPFGTANILNQELKKFFSDENTIKYYNIKISGYASKLFLTEGEKEYNEKLAQRRINAAIALIEARLTTIFDRTIAKNIIKNNIETIIIGSEGASEAGKKPENINLEEVKKDRRVEIVFERNNIDIDKKEEKLSPSQIKRNEEIKKEIVGLENKLRSISIRENIFNKRDDVILNGFESITKNKYYPLFHSQTPEDFHRRLTFLQQCTRQGAAKRYDAVDEDGILRAKNSVFGKQPICILRVGDFFNTKVIIESVTIDYNDTTWDLNPEGFGLQPMIANITLQMKLIGGQSLQAPIDALQNAVSFNYYANSTFSDEGIYARANKEADDNYKYLKGIINEKREKLDTAYDILLKNREGTE